MNMSLPDLIILIIIAGSAIWGIFKGFVSQIVSLAALILGVWCAFKFSGYLSAQAKELLSISAAQSTLHIIMFIVILILVLIAGHFLGKALEGIIKLSMLDWLNRLLGFVFAGVKSIIILSLIAYVITYLNNIWDIIPQETLAGSKGYQFLTGFSAKVFPYLQNIFQ